MGLESGIRAGKAYVEFILQDKGLETKLARWGGKLQTWGRTGLAATAPLVAAFTAGAVAFTSVGSALNDMSERTGKSVEDLSELRFAADQSGTAVEDVEGALRNMAKKGLDVARFDELAADIAAIEDPTLRARAAMLVFGKSGTKILPMLENLPELRKQARALGVTMSGEQAAAADRLGDAYDALKLQVKAMGVQIGAALAGPLTDFLEWLQPVLADVIQWIRENPRLVQGIAAVTFAVVAASTALVAFGTLLTVISLHPIVAALTAISLALVLVAGYFYAASDAATVFERAVEALRRTALNVFGGFGGFVGSRLGLALGSSAVSPAPAAAGPAGQAVADVAPVAASGFVDPFSQRQTELLEELVRFARRGGFVVGAD